MSLDGRLGWEAHWRWVLTTVLSATVAFADPGGEGPPDEQPPPLTQYSDASTSTVALTLSAGSQEVGTATPVEATASVLFSDQVSQPGNVEFRTGDTLLGSVPLGEDGSAKYTIPANTPAGEYQITAKFVPTDLTRTAESVSDPATLTVTAPLANIAPLANLVDEWSTSFEDTDPALDGTTITALNTLGGGVPGSLGGYIIPGSHKYSTQINEGEGAPKLTDGDIGTKWLATSGTNQWVSFELTQPKSIARYTITSANDASERDPATYRIEGSTNGTTWDVITRNDNAVWETRGQTKEFTLDAPSAEYKFFRFYVEKAKDPSKNMIQVAELTLFEPTDGEVHAAPLDLVKGTGPTTAINAKTNMGWTGKRSLAYSGSHLADGPAKSESYIAKDVNVLVGDNTELSFKIHPALDVRLDWAATYAGIDLEFADGTRLSSYPDAKDVNGFHADSQSWGDSNLFIAAEWNSTHVELAQFKGKVIKSVIFTYANDGRPTDRRNSANGDSVVRGWIDDVRIGDTAASKRDTSDGFVSYVDTRRGTNADGGFSRGLNIPAATWPNGFNFYAPATAGRNENAFYAYQKANNSDNRTPLQAFIISHQPSHWMGDRMQLGIMPSNLTSPNTGLTNRQLFFGHENELARPDYYKVKLDNGMEASLAPADHGAVFRFDLGKNSGSVILDRVGNNNSTDGGANLNIDQANNAVYGWVDHGSGLSAGKSRMFFYGTFDQAVTGASGSNSTTAYARFENMTSNVVELRIATSFISRDQAKSNLDQELTGKTFEQVKQAATNAWNERLSVIDALHTNAPDNQVVNLYSNLYRLNMYPNSQHEMVNGVMKHASPTAAKQGNATATNTNAQIFEGPMYVNNGFWDTYRSAWPMISFLYPKERVNNLVEGFVNQYREGGWIARWSSPGYADLMTGTSSDVSFAEAYMNGKLDVKVAMDAFDSGLRNATVKPTSSAVGRKGLEQSPFLGFTTTNTGQSVSWGMEGYINDFGLYHMAEKLAADPEVLAEYGPERVERLKEEAQYLKYRSEGFVNMFDPQVIQQNADGSIVNGGFAPRRADGTWDKGAALDPMDWGGAYTEGNGWTFFYHAFFNVPGMAALYNMANEGDGGNTALIDSLYAYFSQPDLHARNNSTGIHEAREAREVRLGQLGISNQISYHVPYIAAAAGYPQLTQEVVSEIMHRIFTGYDIGQGYLGDEDNGAYSSWYLFGAMGFYPLQNGAGNYTIGTPLLDKMTINLEGGKTLTINAPGAQAGNKYVAAVNLNGTEITDTNLNGDALRAGGELNFTMSATPTEWGKVQPTAGIPQHSADLLSDRFGVVDGAGTRAIDNNSTTAETYASGESVTRWTAKVGRAVVETYTVTSSGSALKPVYTKLEGSNDGGQSWVTLDEREGIEFRWATQTLPFQVSEPQAFADYRLTTRSDAGEALTVAEFELIGKAEIPATVVLVPSALIQAPKDKVVSPQLGMFIGGKGKVASDFEVTYEINDGNGPQPARIVQDVTGAFLIRPVDPLNSADLGVYDLTISVKDLKDDGQPVVTGKTTFTVVQDRTLAGAFNNVCITDKGTALADCDGQGWQYDRGELAATGFVQGQTVKGSDDIYYALPGVPAGAPDNVTDEGGSFVLQLPADATKLAVLGASNEGEQKGTAVIEYNDGTTQDYALTVRDWVFFTNKPSNTFANVPGRYLGASTVNDGKGTGIFMIPAITLLTTNADGDAIHPVKLTMPISKNPTLKSGRMHIFAIGTDSPQTGANQGLVLASEDRTATERVAYEGEIAQITSATGEGTEYPVRVNWGDGTAVESLAVTGTGVDPLSVTASHTYQLPGEYTVHVTIDDGIKSETTSFTMTVERGTGPVLVDPIKPDRVGNTVIIPVRVGVTYVDGDGNVLTGEVRVPSNNLVVRAVSAEGYRLNPELRASWLFPYDTIVDRIVVDPVRPVQTGNKVTIPEVEGVIYLDGAGNVLTGQVQVPTNNLTVRAVPAAGYRLNPELRASWLFAFDMNARTVVDPIKPDRAGNTVTIPAVEGVVYKDGDGNVLAAGPVTVTMANLVVIASPAAGYRLNPELRASWLFAFDMNARTMVDPVKPVRDGANITIPTIDGVIYKDADGATLTGVVAVTQGGLVVKAVPGTGYRLNPELRASWLFPF